MVINPFESSPASNHESVDYTSELRLNAIELAVHTLGAAKQIRDIGVSKWLRGRVLTMDFPEYTPPQSVRVGIGIAIGLVVEAGQKTGEVGKRFTNFLR